MIPAVLIRRSTGEIIKRDIYPRLDMQPVSGLDPDLEWLLVYTPYEAPVYDSRIYLLNQVEEVTQDPHPDYAWLNQFRVTYSTTKREVTEIQTAVVNAENEANNGVFPYIEQLKILALGLGVLFRRVEGMTLTTKEIAVKDRVLALAVKIWKNDQTLRDKVAQITGGLEPNIDEGWEKS